MKYSSLTVARSGHLEPQFSYLCFRGYGLLMPSYKEARIRRERKARVFVARDSQKVVGWLLYRPTADKGAYQVQLFVDPTARKQGIGTRLMKMGLGEWAKEHTTRLPHMYMTANRLADILLEDIGGPPDREVRTLLRRLRNGS